MLSCTIIEENETAQFFVKRVDTNYIVTIKTLPDCTCANEAAQKVFNIYYTYKFNWF